MKNISSVPYDKMRVEFTAFWFSVHKVEIEHDRHYDSVCKPIMPTR